VDLRRVIDGIRWVLHTKARWNTLPEAYGKSTTSWRWYNRWLEDGTWAKLEATLASPI